MGDFIPPINISWIVISTYSDVTALSWQSLLKYLRFEDIGLFSIIEVAYEKTFYA